MRGAPRQEPDSAPLRGGTRTTFIPLPSEYPPAKSGALEREPLKAAGKATYAAGVPLKTQASLNLLRAGYQE